MFLLFTSDYNPLYKRNALDVICYPLGHQLRFRYQEEHVATCIRAYGGEQSKLNRAIRQFGSLGLTIYAETDDTSGQRRFSFYPLRNVKVHRIEIQGSVYYVDMELREFVNYDATGRSEACRVLGALRERLETVPYFPLPPIPDAGNIPGLTWTTEGQLAPVPAGMKGHTQGYFFGVAHPPIELPHKEQLPNRAWESVVDLISQASSMRNALFFLIPGLFVTRPAFPALWKKREVAVNSINDGWTSRYRVPMGQSFILKLLFYRSQAAPKVNPVSLLVNVDKDAFAGVSERTLRVESRYNEQRVELVSKRIFENIVTPLAITGTTDGVLLPAPTLLIQLRVPRRVLFIILTGIVLAPILLSLSPDFIRYVGSSPAFMNHPVAGAWVQSNAGGLSGAAKVAAAVVSLWAGWFGFRRLPFGK